MGDGGKSAVGERRLDWMEEKKKERQPSESRVERRGRRIDQSADRAYSGCVTALESGFDTPLLLGASQDPGLNPVRP